jgi:hypothetical protein
VAGGVEQDEVALGCGLGLSAAGSEMERLCLGDGKLLHGEIEVDLLRNCSIGP